MKPSNRKTNGIINALMSFDKYFQSDPDFKMYNVFAGNRDLLFKVRFEMTLKTEFISNNYY